MGGLLTCWIFTVLCLIDVEALHVVVKLLLARLLQPDLFYQADIGSKIVCHTHKEEINAIRKCEELIKLKMHKNGKLIKLD